MDDYEQINKKIINLNNKIYEKSAKLETLNAELFNLYNTKKKYNYKMKEIKKYKRKSRRIAQLIFIFMLFISISTSTLIGYIVPLYCLIASIVSSMTIAKIFYKINLNKIIKQIKNDKLEINDEEINKYLLNIKNLKKEINNFEEKRYKYKIEENKIKNYNNNYKSCNITNINNKKILKYK